MFIRLTKGATRLVVILNKRIVFKIAYNAAGVSANITEPKTWKENPQAHEKLCPVLYANPLLSVSRWRRTLKYEEWCFIPQDMQNLIFDPAPFNFGYDPKTGLLQCIDYGNGIIKK